VARQLNLYEPQFACLQNGGNIAYEKVELWCVHDIPKCHTQKDLTTCSWTFNKCVFSSFDQRLVKALCLFVTTYGDVLLPNSKNAGRSMAHTWVRKDPSVIGR
jgi:hypothetical protein